ncbi:hypothetical protein FLONG3_4302 [Fusarium longipes]|uniref:RING-type domain-containing protein n=1 Tax=Fusarium longipes TaxID=694270 RepID=A0A395SZ31_9HYPO|nr:hypothetical protein FLONG3_4302 [Fusarium longipes]
MGVNTPTIEEMRAETNWPILKTYLQTDKISFEDLELPCAVCCDTISVEDGDAHRATIFPCGHIFGKSCIEVAFNKESTLRPVCFTCREDLAHPQCPHMHHGLPMPCSKEELDTIPPVLAKEGLISSSCIPCLAENTAVELTARILKSTTADGQFRMGLSCTCGDRTRNLIPAGCNPEVSFECRAPEELFPFLEQYEEDRYERAYWFDKTPNVKWRFFMWKVARTQPTFQEYVDYVFFAEGERVQGMSLEELRDEFESKLRVRSSPCATPVKSIPVKSILEIYQELADSDEDDDDEDEDEDDDYDDYYDSYGDEYYSSRYEE